MSIPPSQAKSPAPRISIALATYNGETHLRAQLQSLARQTLLPIELVVTDDGSADATPAIVADFAHEAPFAVRLHRNEIRLGYKGNFLRAASLCTGEIIAFCDQDDIWFPDKLATAAAAFRDPDVMLFHHEARIVRDGVVLSEKLGKTRDPLRHVPALRSPPWIVPPGFSQVFRASILRYATLWTDSIDFHHPEQRESHDEWHFFLASVLGTIAYHATPLADYRQHAGNVFGRSTVSFSVWTRLVFILENRSGLYAKLCRVAGRRSEILTRAAAIAGQGREQARLSDGARAWGELADFYRLRADVYTGRLPGRLAAFRVLVGRHAYGNHAFWSFRRKAFAKDLGLGVLFGPLVLKYGRVSADVDWTCVAGEAK